MAPQVRDNRERRSVVKDDATTAVTGMPQKQQQSIAKMALLEKALAFKK